MTDPRRQDDETTPAWLIAQIEEVFGDLDPRWPDRRRKRQDAVALAVSLAVVVVFLTALLSAALRIP